MAGNDIVCSVESGAGYIVILVITTGSKFFLINLAALHEKRVGKKREEKKKLAFHVLFTKDCRKGILRIYRNLKDTKTR